MAKVKTFLISGLACFFLGAGLPFIVNTPAQSLSDPTPDVAVLPNEKRTDLDPLWAKRQNLLNPAQANQISMRDAASGKFDTESCEAYITSLSYDPSFINKLADSCPPELKSKWLGELFAKMAIDNPRGLMMVVDKANFELAETPGLYNTLNTVRLVDQKSGIALILSNRDKLGAQVADKLIEVCCRNPDAATKVLDEALSGRSFPDKSLLIACESISSQDKGILTKYLKIPAAQKVAKILKDKSDVTAWLTDGHDFSETDWKSLDQQALRDTLYEGIMSDRQIAPYQLNELGNVGADDQGFLLSRMIYTGKKDQALELFENSKDLPNVKSNSDQILSGIATAIYEQSGDVSAAVQLVNRVGNEKAYWNAIESVLSRWAEEDPRGAEKFLPEIGDKDIRTRLKEIVDRASVDK